MPGGGRRSGDQPQAGHFRGAAQRGLPHLDFAFRVHGGRGRRRRRHDEGLERQGAAGHRAQLSRGISQVTSLFTKAGIMASILRWFVRAFALALAAQSVCANPRPEVIDTIAATPAGLVAVTEDGTGLWSLVDGSRPAWQARPRAPNARGDMQLEPVAVSPDGRWLAATRGYKDPVIVVRDAATGRAVREIKAPRSGVDGLRFAGDDVLVALYAGRLAAVWEASSGKARGVFELPAAPRQVAASADGRYLAVGQDKQRVTVYDLEGGKSLGNFELGSIASKSHAVPTHDILFMAFAYDGTVVVHHATGYIQRFDPRRAAPAALLGSQDIPLRGVATSLSPDRRVLLTADRPGALTLYRLDQPAPARSALRSALGEVTASAWEAGSRRFAVADNQGRVELWDARKPAGAALEGKHAGAIEQLAFASAGRFLVSSGRDGSIRVRETATGQEAVRLVGLGEAGWVSMTPAGYFHSSGLPAEAAINVRIGSDVYGIDNFRERYYRPDILSAALQGRSVRPQRTLADTRPPPQVRADPVPASLAADTYTLVLQLTDQGGGIGDVRVLRNDVAVANHAADAQAAAGSQRRSIPVKLAAGRNEIKVIAFNAENSLSSKPLRLTLDVRATQPEKPVLHAMIVGINEFGEASLNLQYAVNDANAIARELRERTRGLYRDVRIELLTTPQQTSRASLIESLRRYQQLDAGDVFMFYVSTHGAVMGDKPVDQEYFLIPSNAKSPVFAHDAISQHELKRLFSSIPAGKKLLLFDTCFAGALGEALYQPAVERGVAENGAVNVLATAIGSTTLAASAPLEMSYEGYQEHGTFTWVVLQAFRGKAGGGKGNVVLTADLARYVAREVPALARRLQREQNPAVYATGQPFPVVAGR
ncbi:caspase domain protein [Bordetella bronchiseptica E012]|nr:caspase domain protein [Bordetella bronchiseptica D993]KDC03542.1 caspase domain protein [Bordetella bronchiseptica E012]